MNMLPKHSVLPTTPVRGIKAEPFTFDSLNYRALVNAARRTGQRKVFGAKRGTRGLIWRGATFAWTSKGHYRAGHGDRRPIQHIIWEERTGRRVPRGMEIWFRDRDRNNFTRNNMELISKAELHRRTHENGEVRQLTHEERCAVRQRWATRKSRETAALLLQRFQKKDPDHANHELIQRLGDARDARRRKAVREIAKRGYKRRKADRSGRVQS